MSDCPRGQGKNSVFLRRQENGLQPDTLVSASNVQGFLDVMRPEECFTRAELQLGDVLHE